MIDKALILLIAMYVIGVCFIGMEYSIAQVYHIDMVSPITGDPIVTPLETYMQADELNERSANIISANFTGNSTYYDRVETFTTSAAFVAWELVTFMSNPLIFYIMTLFGIPAWISQVTAVAYVLLLARAIVGLVRGI